MNVRPLPFFGILVVTVISSHAFASQSRSGTLNLTATVLPTMSVAAALASSDINLATSAAATGKSLGTLTLKYNEPIASMTIATSTPSGQPELHGVPYSFDASGFRLSLSHCLTGTMRALELGSKPIEILHTRSGLTEGISETCQLSGAWVSANPNVTGAIANGAYSMNILLTIRAI